MMRRTKKRRGRAQRGGPRQARPRTASTLSTAHSKAQNRITQGRLIRIGCVVRTLPEVRAARAMQAGETLGTMVPKVKSAQLAGAAGGIR
jgi:hypothetical protein